MDVKTAYRLKLASNPEGEITLDTIEISHPRLSRVFRFVVDTVPLTAKLETGVAVEFEPSTMSIKNAANNNDMDQNASFTIADPRNLLDDELEQIPLDDGEYPLVTFRTYLLSDTSSPAWGPVTYQAQTISQQKGAFTAAVGAPRLNQRETGLIATPTLVPLLRGVLA